MPEYLGWDYEPARGRPTVVRCCPMEGETVHHAHRVDPVRRPETIGDDPVPSALHSERAATSGPRLSPVNSIHGPRACSGDASTSDR